MKFQRETLSRHCVVVCALAVLSACSKPDLGPPAPAPTTTAAEPLMFKTFRTGVSAPKELLNAVDEPNSWSYFDKTRTLKVERREDGTVSELKFDLESSWEGYELREALEKKYNSLAGGNLAFRCYDNNERVEVGEKRFAVSDEYCYAFDESQTMLIYTRHPRYEEAFFTVYPAMKVLVDNGYVKLYSERERQQLAAEKKRADDLELELWRKERAAEESKAAKDL